MARPGSADVAQAELPACSLTELDRGLPENAEFRGSPTRAGPRQRDDQPWRRLLLETSPATTWAVCAVPGVRHHGTRRRPAVARRQADFRYPKPGNRADLALRRRRPGGARWKPPAGRPDRRGQRRASSRGSQVAGAGSRSPCAGAFPRPEADPHGVGRIYGPRALADRIVPARTSVLAARQLAQACSAAARTRGRLPSPSPEAERSAGQRALLNWPPGQWRYVGNRGR